MDKLRNGELMLVNAKQDVSAKEKYHKKYESQKLKFYKRKIEEFKDKLLEEPWDFKIEEAVILLKNEHIEDVEIINQAVKEVMKNE